MAARPLVVATANPGKMREIRQALGDLPVRISSLADYPGIPEPDETGRTFAENARLKATYYARATGQWCLADDSGLEVDSLGGEPGVRSARYAADSVAPDAPREQRDAANNARLMSALRDVPEARRAARFVCHLALAGPDGIILEAHGRVEGRIADRPAGRNGFGYDPVFFVPEMGRTVAELPAEEKNRISHRGKAVRLFAERLRALLAREEG